jgi:outer membrane PBP1 activator LpoA protein
MKTLITLICSTFIIFLLHGCSTSQKLQDPKTPIATEEPSPEDLINQATSTLDTKERAELLLLAAQKYYANKLISQSSAATKDIDLNYLSPENTTKVLLLNLELAVYEDLEWHQKTSIDIFRKSSLNEINIDTLKVIIPLLAKTYQKQNQTILSAILLIEYAGIIDNIYYLQLNDEIWSLLRNNDIIQLNNFKYTNKDQDVNAWLELARSIQQNQISLESQYLAFNQWKLKWPSHPATTKPPKELLLLSRLPETRPSQIIIALPLTGLVAEAAKAIRDGFIAAYYSELKQSNLSATHISFYDTNKKPIEALYSELRSENSLIIGPLTKANVNKLQYLDLSKSTTLALNYLEVDITLQKTIHENLYQFGLNPETEITQLSKQLAKKNLNNIAFIAPETEHGFRIHDSLLQALQLNQSNITESVYYNNQKSLSPSVAKLLATDQSAQRKNNIKRITKLNFEFEPRRRNDIDAIFMLAKPKIASQLNPLFSYHYARNLPIYSSSQIHEINRQQNDLDNIYFVEIPWMLSNTIEIKNTIIDALPSAKNEHSRFYALGADAFTLSPRLKLLKEIQNSQIQGHTGTLSIDNSGIIHRELELASFRKGKAIAIKE